MMTLRSTLLSSGRVYLPWKLELLTPIPALQYHLWQQSVYATRPARKTAERVLALN